MLGCSYSVERYSLSMYVSGLAVECILRGFYWKRNPVLDTRHDLLRLFKECQIVDIEQQRLERRGLDPADVRKAMVDLFGARDTVVRLWNNDYRFVAESQLRSRLRTLGELHTKRGNQVKASALALYNAAKLLVDKGTALWTSAKK
jgi:hypothetical protein